MNLRFVEAFYWVATLRSVTRAAERLALTQSAMSSRIAALETELGVLLLDRSSKQFRLTAAGVRFLAHAQRLLDLQRHIKAEMGGDGGGWGVYIRMGAIESVLHSWLIPWIEDLRAQHPAIELELTVETTPVLVDQVRQGMLDLVFSALPAHAEGVLSRPLAPMDMVLAGSPDIHRRRRYTVADLEQLDFLTFQRGSQPHIALLDRLQQAGVQPRRVHTISSVSAMVQLVQGGFGVATLPRLAVRRLSGLSRLKVLPSDVTLQPLPVHLSYRLDPSSDAVHTVAGYALAFAQAQSGVPSAAVRQKKKNR